MKKIIAGFVLAGCVAIAYAQDCFTYTINTADGRLIACYVCGGIITCN